MIRLLTALCLLLVMPSFTLANSKSVRLAAFEMPPYSGVDLVNQGLFVHVVRKAYEQVGWDVTFKFYPTTRATRSTLTGSIDGFILAPINMPTNGIQYSNQIVTAETAFIARRQSNIQYEKPDDLEQHPVAAIQGWAANRAFPNLNWTLVTQPEQVISLLVYNRVDAILYDTLAFQYMIRQDNRDLTEYKPLKPIILNVQYGVGFTAGNQHNKEAVEALNEGLKRLEQNGMLTRYLAELNALPW